MAKVQSRPAHQQDPLPRWIEPQFAQLVDRPPPGNGWAHEIKYDGYRMHLRLERGKARLMTRTGLDWTEKYEEIADAAADIGATTAYIDGELCALRPDGTASFATLQAATDRASGAGLLYVAFDLLHLDGRNLMARSLVERKERLHALLSDAPATIRYGDHVIGAGQDVLQACMRLGVEGMVSKRLDASYVPGNRGLWRKIKCHHREEFIVVGYSEPEGSRPYLGALLLAYYADDGRLVYAGRAGTGMSDRELRHLNDRLKPLAMTQMPLAAAPPKSNRFGSPLNLSRVHWVRPELVCEVKYMTWTADGLLRHVTYVGLREDKPASEIRR
jgi:DNA ligase D-like protein (predicted ligase)